MVRPFEVSSDYLDSHLEEMVDITFADLGSEFLYLPKGNNFIAYDDFQAAYETLKRYTSAFFNIDKDTIWKAVLEDSLSLVVLRTILGMTPPEWADIAKDDQKINIDARAIEINCRKKNPKTGKRDYISRNRNAETIKKIQVLISTAVKYVQQGSINTNPEVIHRLDKIDTVNGINSLQYVAAQHVPYTMLLYERLLGRPFASQRDSVSGPIGDVMENAIENLFISKRITYRKTKRAERVPNFDQAPDFIIPDEVNPVIVIEAKITSDGGTARDKITRILRLCTLSKQRIEAGRKGFEVVACIDGRGFGERRQDMRRMLIETQGKVFTSATLDDLIEHTLILNYLPIDRSSI